MSAASLPLLNEPETIGAAFVERDGPRRAAAWTVAAALHAALFALLALAIPEQRPASSTEALSVEIVWRTPVGPDAQASREALPDAERARETETPPTGEDAAPTRFQVTMPSRPWPPTPRLDDTPRTADPSAAAVAPGLPLGVRRAIATAYYCRSTALGIRAELTRCPPALDRLALAARVAALDPELFFDPHMRAEASPVDFRPNAPAAPHTKDGDPQLGSASDMRDSPPRRRVDPVFGD
jgi:hypothetical protein